jgi:CBS domain-containing protein
MPLQCLLVDEEHIHHAPRYFWVWRQFCLGQAEVTSRIHPVSGRGAAPPNAEVAADLMLRDPKTMPADASVAEVRDLLANPRVQMVLLADGAAFKGAVTALPADAAPTDLALDYRDDAPETISPDAPAAEAFDRTAASPDRRVIVLDDESNLLGLLCLDPSRTRFCQTPSSGATPD